MLWYADSYFLNNDNKSKRYKIKIFHGNSSNRFVITDLGYWLLYYHQLFRDKYSGSHIRKSNHIQDQRDNIKKKINKLIEFKLISEVKNIESGRNKNIITTEYSFTQRGIIFSWLITIYKKQNENSYQYFICEDIFLQDIHRFLIDNKEIPIFRLMEKFLNHCKKNNLTKRLFELERFIGLFIHLFYSNINAIRQYFLSLVCLDENINQLFIKSIKELDEETKNIVLLQFKLEIESLFEGFHDKIETIKKFESMRAENIGDTNNVVIIGICKNCKYVPFKINIFRLFQLFSNNFEFLMRVDGGVTNTKYKLDNNKISKIIKNGSISKSIDYGEICNICKNHYLRLFFSIEKSVNDE